MAGWLKCRLTSKLAGRHKRALQRWFSTGAAVGLLAGAGSVALLASELATLLAPSAGGGGGAAAAEAAAQAVPRLQLALPGITLPISHAAPLWLALAVSLAVHEVRLGWQGWKNANSPVVGAPTPPLLTPTRSPPLPPLPCAALPAGRACAGGGGGGRAHHCRRLQPDAAGACRLCGAGQR